MQRYECTAGRPIKTKNNPVRYGHITGFSVNGFGEIICEVHWADAGYNGERDGSIHPENIVPLGAED